MPSALVIDDEHTIRAALVRFFRRRGWRCDEAPDGAAGLDRIASAGAAYDVIVCDIRMPVMSGAELHDRIAEEHPHLLERMILIAGDVTSLEVAEFLRRTRCPLLTKPFELPDLAAVVDRVHPTSE